MTAIGTRDEVLEAAPDDLPVIDIGDEVAYPGFIDAHAHWIGDREYYGVETAAQAIELAVARGLDVHRRAVGQSRATRRARRGWPPTAPCRCASTRTSP